MWDWKTTVYIKSCDWWADSGTSGSESPNPLDIMLSGAGKKTQSASETGFVQQTSS